MFITSIQVSEWTTGDNRTDWQNVQLSAQFSPSIDRPAREKCKLSLHKNHFPALIACDLQALASGKTVMIDGQTEVTRDLMAARQVEGLQMICQAFHMRLSNSFLPT
ncbi:hypothetical protein OH720_25995 [Pseudomonas sp. WJP1]|uniref:hypothetical protein n=1 Tax=Pseudomonas sp. WJP1 TaxID=2986947 RepID=UPI00234A08CE|nr:hypothetical protein [Pseudomonas sp. WJP1]WCM54628.1 hypothetical protein OH720_25995 [Pseudomonas sp. WJP1]